MRTAHGQRHPAFIGDGTRRDRALHPLETMWLPSAAPLRGSRVRVYFSTVIAAVGHIFEDFLQVVVVGNAMGMNSDMAEACFCNWESNDVFIGNISVSSDSDRSGGIRAVFQCLSSGSTSLTRSRRTQRLVDKYLR